jgi:hypothetical protein
MTCAKVSLTAAVLVLLGVAAGPVHAGLVSWHYSWSPRPVYIEADHHGTGGVVFTREPWKHATGSKIVSATSVFFFSAAYDRAPDRIVKKPYHLTLKLEDDASRAKGSLTFSGLLSGTFAWDTGHFTNRFTGHTTEAIHLGHYWYWVTIGPFIAPTSDGRPGMIEAHVTVKHNPEPSTWVLAGLGVVTLALATRRKWARRPSLV